MTLGQEHQLTWTGTSNTTLDIEWGDLIFISDYYNVEVDGTGKIKAVDLGSAKITVTARNDNTLTTEMTILVS